jgi:hypothetical protein
LVIKALDSYPDSLEMLDPDPDPDPYSMNPGIHNSAFFNDSQGMNKNFLTIQKMNKKFTKIDDECSFWRIASVESQMKNRKDVTAEG